MSLLVHSVHSPATGTDWLTGQAASRFHILRFSSYAALMIEEGREPSSDTSTTSADMTEALDAVKASSPGLAAQIDAAGVSPDKLADAHGRATSGEHEAAQPAAEQGSEQA